MTNLDKELDNQDIQPILAVLLELKELKLEDVVSFPIRYNFRLYLIRDRPYIVFNLLRDGRVKRTKITNPLLLKILGPEIDFQRLDKFKKQ